MFQKLSKEERASRPLDRRGRKEAKALAKGVRRFLHYNDDLIPEEKKGQIRSQYDAFVASLADRGRSRRELEAVAEELTETCKKSVKEFKSSAWKENIETIFVVLVILMGVRAYFFQQFKIPTGSMQPTLNGIIAYPTKEMNSGSERYAPEGYERPGLLKRAFDGIWYGRSHVNWEVKEDDVVILDKKHFYEKNHFLLFPRTYLVLGSGKRFSAPGTISRIQGLLSNSLGYHTEVKAGTVLAKGYVDTGDQLVVNKFIYHWKRPTRGEVFVFDTQNIPFIQASLEDPRQGSQHYIKRLGGVPGDTLEIIPPLLKVNGEVAAESGFRRVMAREGYYTGYTIGRSGVDGTTLGPHQYWALGDNSANSSDSRDWGVVPEENIVGRAAFVYYPFGHHFGFVD